MAKNLLNVNYVFYLILGIIVALYTYFTVKTFAPVNGYIGDEVWYPTAAYNYLKLIFHVTPPMYFPYPNEAAIQTYVNLSHPPLAKYIMAVFILLMGYSPAVWRMPSWIIGDLLIVAGFFLGREIVGKDVIGNLAGVMIAVLLVADPNLWLLHSIAMLEIYVAFFSFLSLLFLFEKKILLASIFLGLTFLSKESSFVLIIPFLYYLGELQKSPFKRVLYSIGVPVGVYLVGSIPLMIYLGGFINWLTQKYDNMFAWDLTNGHITLSAVTQISTPWGWFLNIHPFFMGYNLYANVNPVVMFLWLGLTPIAFFLKDLKTIIISMFAWSEWLGFTLVYFLGNHTLFSFYVTDFAPFVDSFVVIALFLLAKKYVVLSRSKHEKLVAKDLEIGKQEEDQN